MTYAQNVCSSHIVSPCSAKDRRQGCHLDRKAESSMSSVSCNPPSQKQAHVPWTEAVITETGRMIVPLFELRECSFSDISIIRTADLRAHIAFIEHFSA